MSGEDDAARDAAGRMGEGIALLLASILIGVVAFVVGLGVR